VKKSVQKWKPIYSLINTPAQSPAHLIPISMACYACGSEWRQRHYQDGRRDEGVDDAAQGVFDDYVEL